MRLLFHPRRCGLCMGLLLTFCCVLIADEASERKPLLSYRDEEQNVQPVRTPQDWERRRAQILAGMQEAMGPLPDRSNLPPLDVQILDQVDEEGFTRFSITLLAEKEDRVPAYLYVPAREGAERLPAMLALHQTSVAGKGDLAGQGAPNMGYAPELARRGYVVLCPDYPSFGDYAYDFAADDYVSGSMKGIFNHMRCVDLLQERDDVDPQRIGVIGHSLGGHNALFVAAFDERLKVVVSSCGWTPFHDYYEGNIQGWTGPVYMPRLREVYELDPDRVPFDFDEVIAAIAPRHFFSSSPVGDGNFDVEGVKKAEAAVRPVFELLGAKDALKIIYPDCGHDFPPEVREEAFAFVDSVLKTKPAEGDDFKAELPRIPPKEPAEQLKTFSTLPGFKMDLVASEPLVRSPVAVAFDELGAMFVVEMRDYSEQADERLGVVKRLEDTDDDGHFDKATVYADDLSWPTAVACFDGGIFIGAAPDILYVKDHDGDGQADERKTIFTGFSRSNVQGLLNSFHWTLDNRIHGSASITGGTITSLVHADRPPLELSGRDFSFDPRTLDLRAESGGGQHGMSFDDWGRKFVSSNSDHIQMVLIENRYLARSPLLAPPPVRISIAEDGPQAKVFRTSPVEPWRILRTQLRVSGAVPGSIEGGGTPAGYFTGATGVTIYRGDAWPDEYRGQAFIGDVGSNIVHRKVLEPDGIAMTARRVDEGKEFVASTDTWFRPAQFANAPDGTLHIIDVCREVIEHPHSIPPQIKQHLDLTSGRDRGRIYRLLTENFEPRPLPNLKAGTTAELVETLAHPNAWHRETASRLLFERQDPAAVPLLEKLASSSPSPLGRLHALYALAGAEALKPEVILPRLSDDEPRVREHAVRLAEMHGGDDATLRKRVIEMAADPDQRVRYQVAFSLADVAGAERQDALVQLLASDGNDPYVRFAALSSVDDAGRVLQQLAESERFRKADHRREVVSQLAALLGARADVGEVASGLRGIELWASHDADTAGAAVVALREGLTRANSPLLATLGQSEAASQLLGNLLSDARKAAADDAMPPEQRSRAIRSLASGNFNEDGALLEKLLDGRQSHEVQLAAVATLASFDDPEAADVLVRAWPRLSPPLRAAASDALFARPERLSKFLDAIESGKIPPSHLDASRIRLLESVGSDDPLVERARKLLAPSPQREEVLAKYQPALTMEGDVEKGRLTFGQLCSSCHKLEGIGHEIGPNLAAVAARGADAILVNVIDPNREVNPQFVDYVVQTRDGRTLTGLLAAETPGSITLLRAQGETQTILRADIRRMQASRLSLMPEGLEAGMDVQGMADLIAFITSVK